MRAASQATEDPYYKYHYKVVGFFPRTDVDMGRWGFSIELDYEYARRLVLCPIKPEYRRRLLEMAAGIQEAVFNKQDRLQRRPSYNFWEDTCLLTNVTVEPGNACGLDMEFGTFESVKRGGGHKYSRVQYFPHNVDSVYQAAALLGVWTCWYDLSESLMSEEAP